MVKIFCDHLLSTNNETFPKKLHKISREIHYFGSLLLLTISVLQEINIQKADFRNFGITIDFSEKNKGHRCRSQNMLKKL